jgi:hypothetical protein
MMRKLIYLVMLMSLLLVALPSAAQEGTPTLEATVEATDETTPEATVDVTSEVTPEATSEATDEATSEATSEATAETTAQVTTTATATGAILPGDGAGITVSDQIVLNGAVIIDEVIATAPGFVSIFATDASGADAHLVGIAPVEAGTSEDVAVVIDGAMATPYLTAQVHIDDNQPGVFEFGKVSGADMALTGADAAFPAARAFKIAGIFSYDQQPFDNSVVVASVISEIGGWLVIHAEENGQPGPVLGQTLLEPGTNPAVRVTLAANGQTPVIWPMIHVDDTTIGTYEFGTVANADLPIFLGDVTATRPLALTDTPTLVLADNTPLQVDDPTVAPSVSAAEQVFDVNVSPDVVFVVDNVVSVGPGFVDIHADANGHPSGSLGYAPLLNGQNISVAVMLMPQMTMPITPVVWPMLHSDTNENGIYDYLMLPGEDLPVVYNGAVVTVPVNISGSAIVPILPTAGPTGAASITPLSTVVPTTESTAEATSDSTAEATDEATAEATSDSTAEATDEATAEATSSDPSAPETPEGGVVVPTTAP